MNMNFFVTDYSTGCRINGNHVIEEFCGGAYIPFATGVLRGDLVGYYFRNYMLIMRSDHKITLIFEGNNVLTHPPGAVFCGPGVDVNLLSAKILIITPDFFSNHCEVPSFRHGFIRNPHEGVVISLFDMIDGVKTSINAILAIANIAVISAHKDYKHIMLRDINENYLNPDYNLDELCKRTSSSRRSVQYALRSCGTSFSSELKRLRVLKLKSLINMFYSDSEKKTHRVTFYCFRAGFKSAVAAKRDFKKVTGIELKCYIKHFSGR